MNLYTVTDKNRQPSCPKECYSNSRNLVGRPAETAVLHQHPTCARGLNHEELDGEHIPSHAGDGAVHFCGLRTQKKEALKAQE